MSSLLKLDNSGQFSMIARCFIFLTCLEPISISLHVKIPMERVTVIESLLFSSYRLHKVFFIIICSFR